MPLEELPMDKRDCITCDWMNSQTCPGAGGTSPCQYWAESGRSVRKRASARIVELERERDTLKQAFSDYDYDVGRMQRIALCGRLAIRALGLSEECAPAAVVKAVAALENRADLAERELATLRTCPTECLHKTALFDLIAILAPHQGGDIAEIARALVSERDKLLELLAEARQKAIFNDEDRLYKRIVEATSKLKTNR